MKFQLTKGRNPAGVPCSIVLIERETSDHDVHWDSVVKTLQVNNIENDVFADTAIVTEAMPPEYAANLCKGFLRLIDVTNEHVQEHYGTKTTATLKHVHWNGPQ